MATTEEQQQQPRKEEKAEEEERLYKTKVVQFLGRKTLIILQNDNGPCPLLAICNVLLLKNNLNLTLDASEVSLQKLLSLVAERLIDSNSNTENVDAGYLENQQQNIADAIDLLPRLATGIDVNIKFRRIDDFEFTRECAIFDLLDIPLYHGWIVDPQDHHTADAIGSKSYNTLMGELVALETRNPEGENKDTEEDCVDFAAATTATLGVPSPCLSRGRSFDDSPPSVSSDQKVRKGDLEEEEELLRVLQLSKTETPNLFDEPQFTETYSNNLLASSADSQDNKNAELEHLPVDATDGQPMDEQQFQHQELCGLNDSNVLSSYNYDRLSSETSYGDTDHSSSHIRAINPLDQLRSEETKLMEQSSHSELVVQNQSESLPLLREDSFTPYNDHMQSPEANHEVLMTCPREVLMSLIDHQREENESAGETLASARKTESDVVDGMRQNEDLPKVGTSSVNDGEPLYEGEDCILDSGCTYENREPMYEGEQILAQQADKGTGDASDIQSKDGITPQKGELIKNFLRNNASQLTIYGLFCLQEGLKERELCVFFRNNHFSTMFKFNGELYLLATDQGYINQPDLVWEKLNEVNGDTVFMTGNFTEFKVDNHGNDTWDEQNAVASTADYLASFDNSAQGGSTMNSDLQLAIQLQQQEFENQPKRHNNLQQSSTSGSSRLVTGPQVQRSHASGSSSTKPDSKSKEKCIVM